MSKLQIVLLALFILGIVGAVNSITNQSTIEKEKGFLNGVLSLIGLTYKPEPEPAREFDFVPGQVTSEVSKLTPESLKASPTPSSNQNNFGASPSPSPSNQYNFSFSNELPIPPVAPNQQTLGAKSQNIPPSPPVRPSDNIDNQKPPIPPVSPNQQSSKAGKSADIISTILRLLSLN